jgi:zinc D-Ala-D-Ala carboxypeptidase
MTTIESSPHFTREELACSFTNNCAMDLEMMEKLEALREEFGQPMRLSSAYRDPKLHPRERMKPNGPGYHGKGMAVDVLIHGPEAIRLLKLAIKHGFNGLGINQRNDFSQRFIHLDLRKPEKSAIWSY